MFNSYRVPIISLFFFLFCSCNSQPNHKQSCSYKFKLARDIAYKGFERKSALDSSLHLVNQCMECDSIRIAVVDFKITLLISLKKYAEGIEFVKSLNSVDFTFDYKKSFIVKGIEALDYNDKNDTVRRNMKYKEIANDIELYIKNRTLSNKEFEEVYTDLFAIKKKYLSVEKINQDVDYFIKLYPDKKEFFDFFKK